MLESNAKKAPGHMQSQVTSVDDRKISRQEILRAERRVVKLVELELKFRLQMIKVEESICSGKVMCPEFLM